MRIALGFGALALLLAACGGTTTSNGTTTGSGTGPTAGIDGTWDITQAGGDTIGAS